MLNAEVDRIIVRCDEHGTRIAYVTEWHTYSGQTHYCLYSARDVYEGRVNPPHMRRLIDAGTLVCVGTDEHDRPLYMCPVDDTEPDYSDCVHMDSWESFAARNY
jgi:hypothetical protein